MKQLDIVVGQPEGDWRCNVILFDVSSLQMLILSFFLLMIISGELLILGLLV